MRNEPPPSGGSPRERLWQAYRDLHPRSAWGGALLTALRAIDARGPSRTRVLFWLHDALIGLLPPDRRDDTVEQRILRRAATAVEDEIVEDHVSALRIA